MYDFIFYVFLQCVLIRTLHNENDGKSVIRRSTLSTRET